MKRKSFSVLFFINKAKLLKNGEAGIYMRISACGKRAEANIKRSVEVKNWDQSKEMTKGRDRRSNEINDCIRELKLRALTVHKELELQGRFFSARLILDMVFNNENTDQTILKLFRKHNEECRKLIGIDYVKVTVSRFDNCCKYIETVIREKYGKEDLTLGELDGEFVRAFEIYLKTERGCAQNTVVRYMKSFKKIINLAIANKQMTHNPFVGLKFQNKEVIKDVLSKEEIDRLMAKEFENERLNYVKDTFLFCIFTGLAYIDAYTLRPEHIITDNQGDMWIRKTREKTNNMCNIPMLKVAQQILAKYKGHPLCEKAGTLLPICSNQKMNSYLKEIAIRCDINKKLTTHDSRHVTNCYPLKISILPSFLR